MKKNAESTRVSVLLSDEAIDWLVRLQSGHATADDRKAWLAWRGQSEAHENAATEAETIWHGIGVAGVDYRQKERGKSLTRRIVIGGGLAVLGGGIFMRSSLMLADHVTGIAEMQTVQLADGSTVLMNAGTAISVDFSHEVRRLALHQGQAQFSVFHDPNRPFIVQANGVYARALGTVYDVNVFSNEVTITTLEGSVEVSTAAPRQAPVKADAGYSVRYASNGVLSTATAADIETETAWQRGKLVFNRRALGDVVEELQRYRRDKIVITNSSLKTLEVSGVFDVADPDIVLQTIEATLAVDVIRLPFVTIIR